MGREGNTILYSWFGVGVGDSSVLLEFSIDGDTVAGFARRYLFIYRHILEFSSLATPVGGVSMKSCIAVLVGPKIRSFVMEKVKKGISTALSRTTALYTFFFGSAKESF